MSNTTNKSPFWAQQSLQGITYWIGHRRCLYRHYPLAEGALVAEICNLIHANLRNRSSLRCEVRYEDLLPGIAKSGILTAKARADLVVMQKPEDGGTAVPKFVIEVKRASAARSQIDNDLQRLAEVRNRHPKIRAFMFLVAEATRPTRFVSDDGTSITGQQPIEGYDKNHYRVIRTWKALHAKKNLDRAQYACLVEVFRNRPRS